MATDLVTIATTAALTQFVGPAFKHLGEQALERAKQVAGKAAGLLGAVGREPQPVEPKLLLPLVQAASLETDPTLAAHWAALLANAADPAREVQTHPSYTEVLRQLTPMDAQVLAMLHGPTQVLPDGPAIGGFSTQVLISNLGLTTEEACLTVDNLLRLQLCRVISTSEFSLLPVTIGHNVFGSYFLQAVTPPTF